MPSVETAFSMTITMFVSSWTIELIIFHAFNLRIRVSFLLSSQVLWHVGPESTRRVCNSCPIGHDQLHQHLAPAHILTLSDLQPQETCLAAHKQPSHYECFDPLHKGLQKSLTFVCRPKYALWSIKNLRVEPSVGTKWTQVISLEQF